MAEQEVRGQVRGGRLGMSLKEVLLAVSFFAASAFPGTVMA